MQNECHVTRICSSLCSVPCSGIGHCTVLWLLVFHMAHNPLWAPCTNSAQMGELQEEQEEEYGQPEPPQPAAAAAQPTTSHKAAAADSAADAAAANGSSPKQPPAASSDPKGQEEAAPSSSSKSASKPPLDTDLDFEADEMSYWERQLLTASLALLEASTAVVKAFGKALLQGPGLVAGSEVLDGWESCLWHTKHLRRAVEDMGAAMYPPQVCEGKGAALWGFGVCPTCGVCPSGGGVELCCGLHICCGAIPVYPPQAGNQGKPVSARRVGSDKHATTNQRSAKAAHINSCMLIRSLRETAEKGWA